MDQFQLRRGPGNRIAHSHDFTKSDTKITLDVSKLKGGSGNVLSDEVNTELS